MNQFPSLLPKDINKKNMEKCPRLPYLLPVILANADVSSKIRVFNFILSLTIHPHFGYASSRGSGESVH